jgi:hypothetical protein
MHPDEAINVEAAVGDEMEAFAYQRIVGESSASRPIESGTGL